MPATAAFCTSSNESRPDTSSTSSASGSAPSSSAWPIELVERVVPADVFADRDELARRGEARGGVQPAGLVEHLLVRGQAVGQRREQRSPRRVGPSPTGAHRTSTSSSAALPQIPHDEFAR